MSANANVLRSPEWAEATEWEKPPSRGEFFSEPLDWSPGDFAREQIRNLVRRLFFSGYVRPLKQIAFCAMEAETDMAQICDQVGCALSLETNADVAIVGDGEAPDRMMQVYTRYRRHNTIKSWSTQSAANLWRVPGSELREYVDELKKPRFWPSCLAKLRVEFEFAVIHGPVAGISSETILLGQSTDGIVLVLGAHNTRRATARKIKENLEGAQCRILGTVLSGRTFPVPEKIYRRL
jgi:hypothetical protein